MRTNITIEILLRDEKICQTKWEKFELISGFDLHGQGEPSDISIHHYKKNLYVAPHISLELPDPTREDLVDLRLNMTLKSSFCDALLINIIPTVMGVARTARLYQVGRMHYEWKFCGMVQSCDDSLLDTIWEVHDANDDKLLFTIGINNTGPDRVLTSSMKVNKGGQTLRKLLRGIRKSSKKRAVHTTKS